MEQQEKYLGGVTSFFWGRGFRGGYTIIATTRRLIGVKLVEIIKKARKSDDKTVFEELAKPSQQELTEEQTRRLIQEALKIEDFEVSKENIQKILLHRPGTFRGGKLTIQANPIGEIEIKIFSQPGVGPSAGLHRASVELFEEVGKLMQTFYPEILELQN
jgi:hypothetical protein